MKAIRRNGFQHIALVLMVAFAAGTLVLSAGSMHQACAAKLHDCGTAAKIAPRCCGDRDQSANRAGLVPLRESRSSGSIVLTGFVGVTTTSAAPVGSSLFTQSQHLHQPNPLSLFAALRL